MAALASRIAAPARAGALSGLFAWLAVHLQLAIANLIGFSPLFALGFGIGVGLAAALAGALVGVLLGLFLRTIVATVVAVLAPVLVLVAALAASILAGGLPANADILLGATVQSMALAFIGGAACTIFVLVSGKGLRSGTLVVLGVLAAGGLLARGPAPSREEPDAARLATELKPSFRAPPVLVLALDGLDWRLLDPMIAEDQLRPAGEQRLPAFAALVDGGSRAPLESLRPTDPAVLWTSVSTGSSWTEHGLRGSSAFRAWGLDRALRVRGTMAEPVLRFIAERAPEVVSGPHAVQGTERDRRTFWEVLGQGGVGSVVVGWPYSHPAPFFQRTTLVSDQAFLEGVPAERSVWPEEVGGLLLRKLVDEARSSAQRDRYLAKARGTLEPLALPASPGAEALTEELVRFQQQLGVFSAILDHETERSGTRTGAARVFVLYSDLLSFGGRHFWPSNEPGDPVDAVLPELYGIVDVALHNLIVDLTKAGADYTVFVLSAHGFEPLVPPQAAGSGLLLRGTSRRAPAGVFLASGPFIQERADLGRVRLQDVAPTILYSLGLPLAQDLSGRAVPALFRPDFRAQYPARSIKSFETPGWRDVLRNRN